MTGERLTQKKLQCAACGARFEALAGPATPELVFCTHCGLRHSREELLRRAARRRGEVPGK